MMTCTEDILKECKKCIQCGICENHCPIRFSAREMIKLYKEERYIDLHNYIYDNHPFPIICGYICPNHFCMNNCPKDIDIKSLRKKFALSYDCGKKKYYPKNGKKIAIVGGGVSGLTCAWYLYKEGYTIDLYEKSDRLGGELNLIPEERLPKDKLDMEITRLSKYIDNLYLNIEYNPEKSKDYDKVIYCIGSEPRELYISTEDSTIPVIYYDEYLANDSDKEDVAIIGGGNVALDCALHNKGHSTICVRRNYWDMRIDKKDFITIIDKNISVIDNFTPLEIKYNTLVGTYYGTKLPIIFDKVVIAIGREPISKEDLQSNEITIPSQISAIETVGKTLDVLKKSLF